MGNPVAWDHGLGTLSRAKVKNVFQQQEALQRQRAALLGFAQEHAHLLLGNDRIGLRGGLKTHELKQRNRAVRHEGHGPMQKRVEYLQRSGAPNRDQFGFLQTNAARKQSAKDAMEPGKDYKTQA